MNGSGDPISIATTASPVDLVVDVVLDKLVVVTSDRSVTSFSFDGQDSESIVPIGSESVSGGAVFEDYIYLTYPSTNIVARYNKFPRREGELAAIDCAFASVYVPKCWVGGQLKRAVCLHAYAPTT